MGHLIAVPYRKRHVAKRHRRSGRVFSKPYFQTGTRHGRRSATWRSAGLATLWASARDCCSASTENDGCRRGKHGLTLFASGDDGPIGPTGRARRRRLHRPYRPFLGRHFFNLVKMLQDSASKLPMRPDDDSPYIRIEIAGRRTDQLTIEDGLRFGGRGTARTCRQLIRRFRTARPAGKARRRQWHSVFQFECIRLIFQSRH